MKLSKYMLLLSVLLPAILGAKVLVITPEEHRSVHLVCFAPGKGRETAEMHAMHLQDCYKVEKQMRELCKASNKGFTSIILDGGNEIWDKGYEYFAQVAVKNGRLCETQDTAFFYISSDDYLDNNEENIAQGFWKRRFCPLLQCVLWDRYSKVQPMKRLHLSNVVRKGALSSLFYGEGSITASSNKKKTRKGVGFQCRDQCGGLFTHLFLQELSKGGKSWKEVKTRIFKRMKKSAKGKKYTPKMSVEYSKRWEIHSR